MTRRLIADDFVGAWQLDRVIEDRMGAQSGALTGQASFKVMGGDTLAYGETGRLTLRQGPVLTATRRYTWAFEGARVQVAFEDGRPFHDFTPQGHAAGTDHPCGEDYYTVRYDFTGWPRWTAQWTVIGPRKDYVSTSVYVR